MVAEGVPEAGAGGVHAGQAAVPEMDRADQEHQGHPCALQEVGLCARPATREIRLSCKLSSYKAREKHCHIHRMFVVTALDKEKGVYKETIKTPSEVKKKNKKEHVFETSSHRSLARKHTAKRIQKRNQIM